MDHQREGQGKFPASFLTDKRPNKPGNGQPEAPWRGGLGEEQAEQQQRPKPHSEHSPCFEYGKNRNPGQGIKKRLERDPKHDKKEQTPDHFAAQGLLPCQRKEAHKGKKKEDGNSQPRQ